MSKRDVGYDTDNQPCCSKEVDQLLLASSGGMHATSEDQIQQDRQDDSAESILEMTNNTPSPTASIQQNNEPINEKKNGKPAM